MPVDPSWERRLHVVPEVFAFDFHDDALAVWGLVYVRFGARSARYVARLEGEGRPFVIVDDAELEPPRSPASLELRGEGVWADHNCETPIEHWSLGLEAFALSVDDPTEERGDLVAFGLDLEWEASAPPVGGEGDYSVDCAVHGDVLLGTDRLGVTGTGQRRHAWGRLLEPPVSGRAAVARMA